jgi:DNA-binding MarR family transcriptional regulator
LGLKEATRRMEEMGFSTREAESQDKRIWLR